MTVHADLRIAARHEALHANSNGTRSKPSAIAWMPSCDAGDVRLTMGGEPTFVSIDDADGAEWTTGALGPKKRRLAVDLLLKTARPFRAAARCCISGRASGIPASRCRAGRSVVIGAKTAIPSGRPRRSSPSDDKDYGYNAADARAISAKRSPPLEVDASFIMTAYEDVFYYLWKERRLPVNVDPLDSKLEDPVERARLARVFEEGLGKPIGYVLPLRRIADRHGRASLDEPAVVSALRAACF